MTIAADLEALSPGSALGSIEDLEARLSEELRRLGRVVVAFSGGVDSSFLAAAADRALGADAVLCVTAVSPSLAPEELEDCRRLAAERGWRWRTAETAEMEDPAYVRNDLLRCYHCKSALMDALEPIGRAEQATVVLGVNLDDLGENRPGQRAAAERGAAFPLVKAGFAKVAVREASKRIGLDVWDKPAAACLASRVPHGTPVTFGVLSRVGSAESALRALGFSQLRVRHHGELARIEVPLGDLSSVLDQRPAVVEACASAGYRWVTLDLEGFRSGNMSAPYAGGKQS